MFNFLGLRALKRKAENERKIHELGVLGAGGKAKEAAHAE